MKTLSLQDAETEIASISARLTVLKNYVNSIYVLNGQEPLYSADQQGLPTAPVIPKPVQAPDEFTNKAFALSARTILTRRKETGQGPMSADEIYEALKSGGYSFDVSGIDPQKNGVKIALGKNSQTFTKIPNSDLFGLVEWYGARTKKAQRKPTDAGSSVASEDAADEQDNADEEGSPAGDGQDAAAA